MNTYGGREDALRTVLLRSSISPMDLLCESSARLSAALRSLFSDEEDEAEEE